jgi:hypothetical protein
MAGKTCVSEAAAKTVGLAAGRAAVVPGRTAATTSAQTSTWVRTPRS